MLIYSFIDSYDSSVILLITYIGGIVPAAVNRKVRTPPSSYRVYGLLGFKEKMAFKMVLKDKQYWVVYPVSSFIQYCLSIIKGVD